MRTPRDHERAPGGGAFSFQHDSEGGRLALAAGALLARREALSAQGVCAGTPEPPGARTVPAQTLLLEGPFRRAYPFRARIRGKAYSVKGVPQDLALHEALACGEDPADSDFLKRRGMHYHDAAKPLLCDIILGQRVGREMAAEKEALKEIVYKMALLLNRADPGPDSTPRHILMALRETRARGFAPIPFALDVVVHAMMARHRSNYGASVMRDREGPEPLWRAGLALPVPRRTTARAPPVRAP